MLHLAKRFQSVVTTCDNNGVSKLLEVVSFPGLSGRGLVGKALSVLLCFYLIISKSLFTLFIFGFHRNHEGVSNRKCVLSLLFQRKEWNKSQFQNKSFLLQAASPTFTFSLVIPCSPELSRFSWILSTFGDKRIGFSTRSAKVSGS